MYKLVSVVFTSNFLYFKNTSIQEQYAYTAGKPKDSALHRMETTLKPQKVILSALLGIEGAFDMTPFQSIMRTTGELGVDATTCW